VLEEGHEALLLNEQHRAESARRADSVHGCAEHPRLDELRGSHRAEIIAHLQGAEADLQVGVRLLDVPARVEHHVPGDAVLFDVVREQHLREVLAHERPVVGHRHDLRARLVEHLPCRRRQPPVAAGGEIGLLHHLPGGLLLRRPPFAPHPRRAVANESGVALLGFLQVRPLAGHALDYGDYVVAQVSGSLGLISHSRPAPRRWW
jgi:hypothetical protein